MAGKIAMTTLIILIIVTIMIVRRMNKYKQVNDEKYEYDDKGCRIYKDSTRDTVTDGFSSSRRIRRPIHSSKPNKCVKKGDNTVNYFIGGSLLVVSLILSTMTYTTMAKYKMTKEQKKGPERPYLLKSTGKLDDFFRGLSDFASSDSLSYIIY